MQGQIISTTVKMFNLSVAKDTVRGLFKAIHSSFHLNINLKLCMRRMVEWKHMTIKSNMALIHHKVSFLKHSHHLSTRELTTAWIRSISHLSISSTNLTIEDRVPLMALQPRQVVYLPWWCFFQMLLQTNNLRTRTIHLSKSKSNKES